MRLRKNCACAIFRCAGDLPTGVAATVRIAEPVPANAAGRACASGRPGCGGIYCVSGRRPMFRWWQLALLAGYALLPVLTVWRAMALRRRGGRGALASAVIFIVAGVAAGLVVGAANAILAYGRVPPLQTARLICVFAGGGCAVWWLNAALRHAALRLAGVPADRAVANPQQPVGRVMLAMVVQRVVVVLLAVPYLLALATGYRPGVTTSWSPAADVSDCAEVWLETGDGLRLQAWWMKATAGNRADGDEDGGWRGRRSVVLCHGTGSGAEQHRRLARLLVEAGYNVLAPQLRGHGRSGGCFGGFGAVEKRDVVAAVRWLRQRHPDLSQRIFGIGTGTGAAALLAAAADPDEGRHIDALVLCEPFARLDVVAEAALGDELPRPLRRLLARCVLAAASVHAGADLLRFAPGDCAADIWPRPVLVIHGRQRGPVPVLEEMEVYRRLSGPREEFWPGVAEDDAQRPRSGRGIELQIRLLRRALGMDDEIWSDPGVQHRTLRFLEEARSAPYV